MNKKYIWGFLIFSFILIGFIGLVLYVNIFALNSERALKKAESAVNFDYPRPKYIPIGYEISYQTNGKDNSISYIYNYAPDSNKNLNIIVTNNGYTDTDVFENFLKNTNVIYSEKEINETTVWLSDNKNALFQTNGILYQIESSVTISTEELIKIVEGII